MIAPDFLKRYEALEEYVYSNFRRQDRKLDTILLIEISVLTTFYALLFHFTSFWIYTLMVIFIIAILASVFAPRYHRMRTR